MAVSPARTMLVGRLLAVSVAVAVVFGFTWALAGSEPADPWDRIENAGGLDTAQRQVVDEVLRAAPCYGGCDGTILECFDDGDPFGSRLANFVARLAAAGRPVESILASVKNRRLSAFPPKRFDVDLSGLVPSGHLDAPVRVVLYADFECSYCRVAATALRELSLTMPEKVSLWFKNYTLGQNPRSVPAALAYLAADDQVLGWEMFDCLFALKGELSDDALERCAVEAGVDADLYHSELRSEERMDRIRAEKIEARSCGIDRTPGVLVNGKLYLGTKTKTELLDRIEEEYEMVVRENGTR